ncbi:hypothetical protein [Nocardia seriolae]|uniref:Uncharacterized protein n=1 Tax=Nocardia seriolae TaxID=37332 RepID=A0ABC9Z4Z8_9NOCA|nr:hypothetical protein [Nocardia seriolae]APB00179.1 hypothetical protein NS506_06142 [Nocardia seriolae]MTJ64855.1 hypothetical protein [Nocardia seriolae]MTJ76177.1 hypothetical protein [Nocardia seriolae]MTK50251.1 hypothetical protein [Nocardia seriolae]MTL15222.1 hypothetical protein [Nocardia seriolae]
MQRDEHSAVHIGGDVTMTGSALAGRDAQVVHADHGAAVTVASEPAAIRRALADVADQIRSAATALPNHADLAETVEQAAAEVARERPNRTILSALMQAVGRGVGAAGDLARSVTAIQTAIDGLFG